MEESSAYYLVLRSYAENHWPSAYHTTSFPEGLVIENPVTV